MWLAGTRQLESGRARRRMFPIHFYSGRNGAGKSLTCVYDTLPSLEDGRPVLSTVRLLDYTNPRPCDDPHCDYVLHGMDGHDAAHPLYVPFTGWRQLLDAEHCDVVMDEITGVADSNEHFSMPSAVRNILPQLRRRDISLRITGLNWIRADKRIREAVNAVTVCKSSFPVRRRDVDGSDRLWRPRRLVKAVTYDAQSLPVDDHTARAYDKADVLVKSRLWIPENPAIRAYDTLAPVLSVGTVTDAGRCAYCSGTRRAPECECPDYVDDRERRTAARKARSAEHGRAPTHRHAAGFDAGHAGTPSIAGAPA